MGEGMQVKLLKRRLLLAAALAACLVLASAPLPASAQTRFSSAENAAAALYAAAKSGNPKQIIDVLGPESLEVVVSGDPVSDAEAYRRFAAAYEEKISFDPSNKSTFLLLGNLQLSFPIPVVRNGDAWQFDVAAGKEEILFRRVGKNETTIIQFCQVFAQAQREYAAISLRNTGLPAYASRILSTEGKRDGLYWRSADNEEQSPLGAAAAAATKAGYQLNAGPQPFHGYLFKVLMRQGAAAKGGSYDYMANGKMIGGFALVAYPAQYGSSGVKTFLINQDGEVYEKDLGLNSANIAEAMTEFNPTSEWRQTSFTK